MPREKILTMKRGMIWKKSFIKINWSLGIIWRTWFWQVFGNWITSRTSISKELRGLEYVFTFDTDLTRWNQSKMVIFEAHNKSRSNCINRSPSIRHSSPKVGLNNFNYESYLLINFSQRTCIYLDHDLSQLQSYALQTFYIF